MTKPNKNKSGGIIMAHRIVWIDTLKAMTIFLVVIGHTIGLPTPVERLIFSFHMPIFFWLSGLLVKKNIREIPFRAYVKNKARSRLIPYISFSILSYILWFFLFRHFGTQAQLNISPIRTFIGIFYGNGINHWMDHNTVLWFFLCLFVTEILFFFLIKIPSKMGLMVALTLFSIGGYVDTWINRPDGFRLPWNMDIAFSMVVFYGIGYLCQPWLSFDIWKNRLFKWGLGATCLALYTVCSLMNLKVAVVAGVYGNYIFFYTAALSGILFWVILAMQIPANRLISKIGDSTLIIFPLHLLVFPFLTAIIVYGFKIPSSIKEDSILLSLAYAVISILILLPVADGIKKYFPVFIGLPGKDKK
ncbi:acyltransferase family protein [Desulfocicer vacuolatum]|nr:acyltransferase family protein [Desulfocicer vacuolatum]